MSAIFPGAEDRSALAALNALSIGVPPPEHSSVEIAFVNDAEE